MHYTKKRKVLDTEVSIQEITKHAFVNFLYGFFSAIVIGAVISNLWWFIFFAYYGLKQLESKILNRNKYVSKFGKNILFPIPSSVGFLLGWYISTLIPQIWA